MNPTSHPSPLCIRFAILFGLIAFGIFSPIFSQTYYAVELGPPTILTEITLGCDGCTSTTIGPIPTNGDIAMCPDGTLYSGEFFNNQYTIYEIDVSTGAASPVFQSGFISGDSAVWFGGCDVTGLFYAAQYNGIGSGTTSLIEFNLAAGTMTNLGVINPTPTSSFFTYNGSLHYNTNGGTAIAEMNISDPSNSTIVQTFSETIGSFQPANCGGYVYYSNNPFELTYTNESCGSSGTFTCPLNSAMHLTSIYEFQEPPCIFCMDLDCDDSSGAINSNFNSPEFNCTTFDGVPISDSDNSLPSNAIITQITVTISGGVQNAPNEFLELLSANNISIVGSGTEMITLIDSGGASVEDFLNALQNIVYINNANPPIPGMRQVTVTATSNAGQTTSAIANVNVTGSGSINVDLGPDIEVCENSPTTFDAGNSGAAYLWSTNETTQTITVTTPGIYSVTVNLGGCTAEDEVELLNLPNVEVTIDGPTDACVGDPISLIINSSSTEPVSVALLSSPGTLDNLPLFIGTYTHQVIPPFDPTTYSIVDVSSSSTICWDNVQDEITVELHSADYIEFTETTCDPDEVGITSEALTNQYGCDSTIITTVVLIESDTTYFTDTTCDLAGVGISTESFPTASGCDSVVITTTSLLESDTTEIYDISCDPDDIGIFTELLTNQNGCDSVVLTTVSQVFPDTTEFGEETCNPAEAGIFEEVFVNQFGCDSLVITTVSLLESDTTELSGSSCDPDDVGTFSEVLINQYGCDSTVITTIAFAHSDTTELSDSSCDPDEVGIFTEVLINQNGCDSTVITTITFAQSDTTELFDSSCDPDDVGTFSEVLINQNGCDSTIITTITFAQSDTTELFDSSCAPDDVGIFSEILTGQNGCDSTVITTITFAQSDTTELFDSSCDPDDVGIFSEILTGQNGCDSTVITTITFAQSDTTELFDSSCDPDDVGIFSEILTGQNGCDSTVITTITFALSDTTELFDSSCDPDDVGIFSEILTGQNGCDSTVITTIILAQSDTTELSGTSCDIDDVGIFTDMLINQNGCDSIVITTITFTQSDTTALFNSSCDPDDVGIFSEILTGQNGCDSTVITTITFAQSDTTELFDSSCDPDDVGIFSEILTGQNGCDSTVITTITFTQSDTTELFDSSCDPDDVGIFSEILTGQNGCDSTVITTITFTQSDTTELFDSSCDPDDVGIFSEILTGQNGCDSTVITTITFAQSDTTDLFDSSCDLDDVGIFTEILTGQNGCDSTVITTITFVQSDTTELSGTSCDPDDVGVSTEIFTNQNGCDSTVITNITLSVSDTTYFYFDSCVPTDTGTVVTVLFNQFGCDSVIISNTILASNPTLLISISGIDCFDENDGVIFLEPIGGTPPYSYSINGGPFQDEATFDNLSAGNYEVSVLDANGCSSSEAVWINSVIPVDVELGDDLFIDFGESTELMAIVNIPFDSLATITWTPLDSAECPECLTQPISPIFTTTFSISIIDNNGCTDEDEMTVFVDRTKSIYVPSAFSPNGDIINDKFYLYAKPGTVEMVQSFLIFDRWGESVWEYFNFHPDNLEHGWDGKHLGEDMNPAVFVWFAEIKFTDGKVELFKGDVVLVR